MSEILLSLENVTMKFGGVTALGAVNLEVKKGEILALIGPNGAGKTTVFNVVTGVYTPTSGTITFAGTKIKKQKRFEITKMGIARTFQNIRLWGDMTTLENVITATDVHKKSGLVGALFGTPRARREERENRERAFEVLKFIGIEEYADRWQRIFLTVFSVDLKSLARWELNHSCCYLMSQLLVLTQPKKLNWLH